MRNIFTGTLFTLAAVGAIAAIALIAPAKYGYIRLMDKWTIESVYKDYSASIQKNPDISVKTAPSEDGFLTANYTVGDRAALFRTNARAPEDRKALEDNIVIGSSSSIGDEEESASLVMMLFQGERKNLVFNYSGSKTLAFAGSVVAAKAAPFNDVCLKVTQDSITKGQRVFQAEINCDLSLPELTSIITQKNELLVKHAVLSERFFESTGMYTSLWDRLTSEKHPSYQNFKKGSKLFLTYVSNQTSMDKGINIVYQPVKSS